MTTNWYSPAKHHTDEDGDLDENYAWIVAFQDAVADMDVETQEAIRLLRRAIEMHFEREQKPKTVGARKWQAWQIVARMIWNKRGINFDEIIVQALKG
jgi:hypothetical protein